MPVINQRVSVNPEQSWGPVNKVRPAAQNVLDDNGEPVKDKGGRNLRRQSTVYGGSLPLWDVSLSTEDDRGNPITMSIQIPSAERPRFRPGFYWPVDCWAMGWFNAKGQSGFMFTAKEIVPVPEELLPELHAKREAADAARFEGLLPPEAAEDAGIAPLASLQLPPPAINGDAPQPAPQGSPEATPVVAGGTTGESSEMSDADSGKEPARAGRRN